MSNTWFINFNWKCSQKSILYFKYFEKKNFVFWILLFKSILYLYFKLLFPTILVFCIFKYFLHKVFLQHLTTVTLLAGTSVSNLGRLQLIQNTFVWVVSEKSRFWRISHVLIVPHWLPVCHRINFNSLPLFHSMCRHDHYDLLTWQYSIFYFFKFQIDEKKTVTRAIYNVSRQLKKWKSSED